ncbi:ceramidase [Exophiala viscosa]|uniref:Ceramidase n=1 Tax=Exophiala viscosa TaxID=2486360 RepID=A0AAN6DY04_9EURO|nr:ceramidase [Exophiala viscosa]KAI1624376.1 ceramidase [Exophiala viscosa]
MGLERNFVGDPHAFEGYWGPPTSVANFCEEDYGVTLYIGEFVNTFTNLAYVYWSINELFPGESLFSTTAFPNLALFFVGVMSFAFHLTLKYGAQLCDDLSMFWVCAAIIYELYTVDQPPKVKVAFGSALTAVLGTISAIHCTLYQLWLHNWTFVLLVTAIWPRVLYLIQRKFKGEEKKYWLAKFRVGGISFVAGFIVWVIDSAACGQLREARRAVGPPWAFVLELHGWWHILTAVGAGYCVRVTKVLTKRSS